MQLYCITLHLFCLFCLLFSLKVELFEMFAKQFLQKSFLSNPLACIINICIGNCPPKKVAINSVVKKNNQYVLSIAYFYAVLIWTKFSTYLAKST